MGHGKTMGNVSTKSSALALSAVRYNSACFFLISSSNTGGNRSATKTKSRGLREHLLGKLLSWSVSPFLVRHIFPQLLSGLGHVPSRCKICLSTPPSSPSGWSFCWYMSCRGATSFSPHRRSNPNPRSALPSRNSHKSGNWRSRQLGDAHPSFRQGSGVQKKCGAHVCCAPS